MYFVMNSCLSSCQYNKSIYIVQIAKLDLSCEESVNYDAKVSPLSIYAAQRLKITRKKTLWYTATL